MQAHTRPIRLVIADRRPIVLQGFASLLAPERDFAIVASCLDGAGCLKAIRKLTPDVVLVEDGFSDVTASEMLAVVNTENLPTRLVFYTASVASGDLAAAIAAGSCAAVSMREKPETLLNSLRLVAPVPDRKETAPEMLTDQDRKIMRLVAYGMSNKEIARQLEVSTGTVKTHLDRIATQLEIKSRTGLAAFALSRLFGTIGPLAALIFAALDDDVHAATTTAVGHTPADTLTVTAADGTELLTIKLNSQKTAAAAGKTAKTAINAGRVEIAAAHVPARTGKPIEPGDIPASSIMMPALNSMRPSLGDYSAFMMTAFAVSVFELLNSGAQAFHLDGRLSVPASATADGSNVALNVSGGADAALDGFDRLAWQNPEIHHQSFAFKASRSDFMDGSGDEVQDAAAWEKGDSGNSHVGSGAIVSETSHGGSEQVAAGSMNAGHGPQQATGADESFTHGQSKSDLLASEGGAAGKQHDQHDPPGHDKQDSPGNDSNHGQSQKDAHASEDSSSVAHQHARHLGTHGSNVKADHAQHDVKTPPPASNTSHSESKPSAGGEDQAVDHADQTKAPVASEDSFHFRKEMAASKASNSFEVQARHGPDSMEHGQHAAEHDGLTPIPYSAPTSAPFHEPNTVDHAKGAQHHLTHDLIV